MNKSELIESIAQKAEINKKQAEAAVNALVVTVADELAKEEKVSLFGFGTFCVTERAAREGRNPVTGEKIMRDKVMVPKFKAAKGLKDIVNK